MANKKTQFNQEFKQDAVNYLSIHPELTLRQCEDHTSIGRSSLARCKGKAAKTENHTVSFIDSSHTGKELEKELKDMF